jgi:enoyl-CoA hydratase/carnithine racemase
MSEQTDASTEVVLLEVRDGVAFITLNRPRQLNALNSQMRLRLTDALVRCNADPAVRVIVLGGAGRSFCAGNDLKESSTEASSTSPTRSEEYFTLYDTIRRLDKALIMRLHGHTAGAGLQISLLADLRIATDTAKIGMTEFNVGMPVVIGSGLLAAVVGEAVMKRLVLLGDFVSGPQALTYNLVHEVVPEDRLDARILEIAAWLASRPEAAVRLTKKGWRELLGDLIDKTWTYARATSEELNAARSGGIPARFGGPGKD